MAKTCNGDGAAYLERLEASPDECDRLIETIAINVSSFFRDPAVYEALAREVLPEIIGRKQMGRSKEIRVWSAGCAAGEEPYSLAILLDRALKGKKSEWSYLIFATDIDNSALERAKAATYGREQFKDTKLDVLDTYFTPHGGGYELRPFVRKMVQFSWDDLASAGRVAPAGSIFGSFDLVLCRNVLIYFSGDVQGAIFGKLHKSLASGGYLVLGDSETLNSETNALLQTISQKNRIYRRPLR